MAKSTSLSLVRVNRNGGARGRENQVMETQRQITEQSVERNASKNKEKLYVLERAWF